MHHYANLSKTMHANNHILLRSLHLNGRRIYGGCTPLYVLFWCLTSFFMIQKRFFANVIKIISGIYGFFIFQMSGGWFPWHPKEGCTPPINLQLFFTDILATASRLNISYGLETLHVQSSRHVRISQNCLRHSLTSLTDLWRH